MRNFKPYLGQDDDDMFSWVSTSPGRIDPRSGEMVDLTAVPVKEMQDMFDWISTSPGRIDPRSGKSVAITTFKKDQKDRFRRPGSGGEMRLPERSMSKFGGQRRREFSPGVQRAVVAAESVEEGGLFDAFGPSRMNGPYGVGCDTCEGMGAGKAKDGPGVALWLFLGTVAVVALEALEVTAWSK
jgi:hypothetical protein